MNASQTTLSGSTAQAHPIFNGKFEILKSLGEGNTSKVYLGRLIGGNDQYAAIKILKEEFLNRDQDSIVSVHNEITILKNLQHVGIINMYEYGDAGQVVKPSGRVIDNLVYIVMEFVQGGLLFDLCQTMGAMGEDAGRFFLHQMLDSVEYMHSRRVVHRDLKLENILVDDNLNLKLADFGFACYKNIDTLKSYRGTMTYMAPEIKEGKQYAGTQVDMFSIGVILFIIVQGIFPFKEARKEEYFYNLILQGQNDTYFQKVNGTDLSDDFKDLILKFFAFDGNTRITLDQIRAHPWMQSSTFNFEATRAELLQQLANKQQAQQQAAQQPMTKPVKVKRTAAMV
jgi:serine/threonine protein kinase